MTQRQNRIAETHWLTVYVKKTLLDSRFGERPRIKGIEQKVLVHTHAYNIYQPPKSLMSQKNRNIELLCVYVHTNVLENANTFLYTLHFTLKQGFTYLHIHLPQYWGYRWVLLTSF